MSPDARASLREILQQPGIWRGRGEKGSGTFSAAKNVPAPFSAPLSTSCPALDRHLPQQGWPSGALTEILCGSEGAGELSLVLPALRELLARQRRVIWVAPPHVPYPPALAQHDIVSERLILIEAKAGDAPWAAEQALRSGACGAVLCWLDRIDDRRLRRLQLAAEQGRCHGFVFRPARVERQSSPAALRLRIEPWGRLALVKCRGRFTRGERYQIDPQRIDPQWIEEPAEKGAEKGSGPSFPQINEPDPFSTLLARP